MNHPFTLSHFTFMDFLPLSISVSVHVFAVSFIYTRFFPRLFVTFASVIVIARSYPSINIYPGWINCQWKKCWDKKKKLHFITYISNTLVLTFIGILLRGQFFAGSDINWHNVNKRPAKTNKQTTQCERVRNIFI